MKKNLIMFSVLLAGLCLIAFGTMKWNSNKTVTSETLISDNTITLAKNKIEKRIYSDFIYDVGPRFNPIKKEDLNNVKSFSNFIGGKHINRIVSYETLKVFTLEGDKKTNVHETKNTGNFTKAQIDFLKSLPHSTSIVVWADYQEKNVETGIVEYSHWTPHLTIVPEKQATYITGKGQLIEYLKEKSKDARTNVEAEKLKPAKLFFTVTKDGLIENVKLDRSSNYPVVDMTMIQLITNTTGMWKPAENANGDKVDQQLVISFGAMGC